MHRVAHVDGGELEAFEHPYAPVRTIFWSIAPKIERPSASSISMRTRSPNVMNGVVGLPWSIVSIVRPSRGNHTLTEVPRLAPVSTSMVPPSRSASRIRTSAALTGDAVIFGGRDKTLRALDPKTGKPLWDFSTKGRIDGSPVVVGQRVFFGSADGHIYAVNSNTGKQVWQYEAGGKFLAGPAVAADRLVIASESAG